MEDENKQDVERENSDKDLAILIEPRKIRTLLREIKRIGGKTEGRLGRIFYGDNPISYQNLMYEIRNDRGHSSITMEDKERCPAYSQTIGYNLFNELFGYNLKGGDHNRRPSFRDITLGSSRIPLMGIDIELNKGTCPFDYYESKHRFSRKSFGRFLERLGSEGYIGAVESITDMFSNLEPALIGFLSKYKGHPISLVKKNGVYIPEGKEEGSE